MFVLKLCKKHVLDVCLFMMNAMSGFQTELKTTCLWGQDKPKRDSLVGWKSLVYKITHTFFLTEHLMHLLFTLKLFLKRKKKKKFCHNVKRVRRRGNHQNIIWSLQESHSPLTGCDLKCKRESESLEKVSSGWEAYNKAS